MSGKQNVRSDQRGIVSFMVTLIMMAVITLIVVGFTQVANRNGREALDRQLSTQAFYAAESGVNVVRGIIQANVTAGTPTLPQTQCDGADYPPALVGPGVKYTCVLVNPNPTSLVYSNLTQQSSIVIPLRASTDFKTLNFSWATKSGAAAGGCASTTKPANYYPAAASWNCGYGILRVDLMQSVALGGPAEYSSQFGASTNTIFFTPYGNHNGYTTLGATPMPFGSAVKAYYGSGCNAAPATACGGGACNTYCSATVSLSGSTEYYARVSMLYNDSATLTVTGTVIGGSPAQFNSAQTLVDVTGQAQDELRRIQVRLASSNNPSSDDIPLNALTSTASVCKRYSIMPTSPDTAQPATLCQ